MHNELTFSGKYLGMLSADFVKVADKLIEASYVIRKQGGIAILSSWSLKYPSL